MTPDEYEQLKRIREAESKGFDEGYRFAHYMFLLMMGLYLLLESVFRKIRETL